MVFCRPIFGENGLVKDWNAVVSIYQNGFRRALRALEAFGRVERSPYHNVLVMTVEDPIALLEAVERGTEESPALYDAIARVAPAICSFEFRSADEFKKKAKSIVLEWLPRLVDGHFTCASIVADRGMSCERRRSSAFSTMRCSRRCSRRARPAGCHSRIRMR